MRVGSARDRGPASIRLDVVGLHHVAPHLVLGAGQRAELFRRAAAGSSPRSTMPLVTAGSFIAVFIALLAFLTMSGLRPGGPYRPMNEMMTKSLMPASVAVGTSGNSGHALFPGDEQRPQLALLDEGRDHGGGVEHRIQAPGDQVDHRRAAALVGHVVHRRAAHALAQQFHRDVHQRARRRRSVVDALARSWLFALTCSANCA